jgi:hypothetical protein
VGHARVKDTDQKCDDGDLWSCEGDDPRPETNDCPEYCTSDLSVGESCHVPTTTRLDSNGLEGYCCPAAELCVFLVIGVPWLWILFLRLTMENTIT